MSDDQSMLDDATSPTRLPACVVSFLRRHRRPVVALTLVLIGAVVAVALGFSSRAHSTEWVRQNLPVAPMTFGAPEISCATKSACVADVSVSYDLLTSSGDWAVTGLQQTTDSPIDDLCVGSSCYAISESGRTVRITPAPHGSPRIDELMRARARPIGLTDLACSGEGNACLMLTQSGSSSTVGRTSMRVWRGTIAPGRNLRATFRVVATLRARSAADLPSALSCPTTRVCFGIAEALWRTRDGGRTWSAGAPLAETPTALFCVSASVCAVGTNAGAVDFTSDAGRTWVGGSPYGTRTCRSCAPTSWISGVYCDGSAMHCLALVAPHGIDGPSGGVFETSDRGRTWRQMTTPGAPVLLSLACTQRGSCWAGGVEGSEHLAVLLHLRGALSRHGAHGP